MGILGDVDVAVGAPEAHLSVHRDRPGLGIDEDDLLFAFAEVGGEAGLPVAVEALVLGQDPGR